MWTSIPNQNIPRSQKDEEWQRKTTDAFISMASFNTGDKREIEKLYRCYNGILDESEYNYVTNPYNSEKGKKRKFPARIQNFPIIKPVIDSLMGEREKRPFNYQVVVTNADAVNRFTETLKKKAVSSLTQMLINNLIEQGIGEEQAYEEVSKLPDIIEAEKRNYRDTQASVGQDILDYLVPYIELFDRSQNAWLDFTVAGETFSYRGIRHNNPFWDPVSPSDLDWFGDQTVEFVEDADAVVVRRMLHPSTIIDMFYDKLSEDQIAELEKPSRESSMNSPTTIVPPMSLSAFEREGDGREVELIHTVWTSRKKIGTLTYVDEMGALQQMTVDEDYTPDKEMGESVRWFWVNEKWESWKYNDKLLFSAPLDIQRNDPDNLSLCKNPYNGIAYSNRNAPNTSLVKLGMPFQKLYNIYHYRLEKMIANSKGQIMLMDINAIPKKPGWDEETFIYYADAMNFAFIDSTDVKHFNQFQVLNMELGVAIDKHLLLLDSIKREWMSLAGFNPERLGDVSPSQGKAVTEQMLYRSSTITESMFRKFERFIERDLNALLDYSKFAWRNGKKAAFLRSDFSQAFLDVDPINHMSAAYGVRVVNSSKETMKTEQLRQFAQAFAQNGAPMTVIAEILDSNNFSKLKEAIAEADAAMQQMATKNEEIKAAMQESTLAWEREKMENDNHQKDLDRESKERIAAMQATEHSTTDTDGDGEIGYAEILQANLKQKELDDKLRIASGDQSLAARKNEQDVMLRRKELELKNKELDIKSKDSDNKLKIAKTNKNRHDKGK